MRQVEELWLLCRDQLEKGETHDDLWNASQKEMKYHGKMSSWNRMYWAKKVSSQHSATDILAWDLLNLCQSSKARICQLACVSP